MYNLSWVDEYLPELVRLWDFGLWIMSLKLYLSEHYYRYCHTKDKMSQSGLLKAHSLFKNNGNSERGGEEALRGVL